MYNAHNVAHIWCVSSAVQTTQLGPVQGVSQEGAREGEERVQFPHLKEGILETLGKQSQAVQRERSPSWLMGGEEATLLEGLDLFMLLISSFLCSGLEEEKSECRKLNLIQSPV